MWGVRLQRKEGWTFLFPSTILVLLAPTRAGWDGPIKHAMWTRLDGMWAWQREWFDRREIDAMTDADVPQLLAYRSVLPFGAPVCISLPSADPRTSLHAASRKYEVRGHDIDALLVSHVPSAPLSAKAIPPVPEDVTDYDANLRLPPGDHRIPLSLDVTNGFGYHRHIESAILIKVLKPGEHALEPEERPEVAAAVRSALRCSIDETSDRPLIELEMDDRSVLRALDHTENDANVPAFAPPTPAEAAELQNRDERFGPTSPWSELCLAWRAELELDGHVIDAWECDGRMTLRRIVTDFSSLSGSMIDPATDSWKPEVVARCVLHVSGDEVLAIKNSRATSFWAGEFRVPLVDVLAQTNAADATEK